VRYAIAVSLVAATLFGREHAAGQERILPFKAKIVKVHDKSLELSLIDRDDVFPREPVRFDVAKETRFEEIDFKLVDGKLELSRKAIKLGDLLPTQAINVIAIMAGERPTILVGVVAGGKVSGAEALKLVAKLGGTVRNVAWKKGETQIEVDLRDSKVTDDALALIALMDDLATLNLSNTKITDKGIAHFANHPSLEDVVLSGTKVTNGVLTPLSTLRRLDRVYVDQTAVTREAMLRFAKKRGLRVFCQIGAGPKCEYRILEELRPRPDEKSPYIYLMKRDVYYARFYTEDAARRKPTTYYHRNGPVGAVLRRFEWIPENDTHSDARLPASLVAHVAGSFGGGGLPIDALACLWSEPAIAVVELNGGTIAAYGRPFQNIDFYNDIPELVPLNVKVDGKDPPFGFIEDARSRGCNVRVIDGPFKKTVRKDAPRGFYSAIFVDITVQQRQDPKAIKKEDVHFDLLTQEGLRDLMDKTTPDGVVCFHTSHRSHEFYKPLAAAAAALGFAAKKVTDNTFDRDAKRAFADDSHFSSEWLVVARSPEHLARFRSEQSKTRNLTWDVPPADEAPAWRDGVEPDMPIRPR
jgi:hypothetical protein